jgi:hypothetical protein
MKGFFRLKKPFPRLIAVFAASVLSLGFVVSNSSTVLADLCTPNGRDCNVGYFSGQHGTGAGKNVITPPAVLDVHDAGAFKAVIRGHIGCFGGQVNGGQNGTGAAFIVLTMLGYAPGTPKNVACQALGTWEQAVDDWAPYTNYDVPDYYFGGLNSRYYPPHDDVQYFQSTRTNALSIVFYNPTTGQPIYAIKKDCANPVGRLQRLPLNYTLTPRIDSVSPTEIESSARMSVTSSVNNNGETNSRNTQWEITRITVQPGKKAPHEDEGPTSSAEAPCQLNGGAPAGNYFRSGDAECQNVDRGSGVFNIGSPAQNLKPGASNIDIGDVPVGTRICFTLSVQPRSNNDGNWAHSKPICTVVGKKPKVQVWGGDLKVRGKIEASTSVKNTNIFGSWVEYGAFSVGQNNGFASGSGLVNQSIADQREWSKFTFANIDNSGTPAFGHYTLEDLPTIAGFFDSASSKQPVGSESVDLSSIVFKNGETMVVRTANNLRVTKSDIPSMHSVVVVAEGNVTIDDDITYANGPFSSVRDIPQVVIIAKGDINIRGSVKHLDAWLIAGDTIDTCYEVTGNLTAATCSDRLEVNGPIVTNHLILKRTAGSNTGEQSGDPAERFNLRPDAYLWANLQARGSNKAQTVYTIELPPRF